MNKLETEIEYIFFKKYNTQIMCIRRTIKNKEMHGIEVNKNDLKIVTNLLKRYKIPYEIYTGKYLNSKGYWTGHNLKFIRIKEPKRYYTRIIEGEKL